MKYGKVLHFIAPEKNCSEKYFISDKLLFINLLLEIFILFCLVKSQIEGSRAISYFLFFRSSMWNPSRGNRNCTRSSWLWTCIWREICILLPYWLWACYTRYEYDNWLWRRCKFYYKWCTSSLRWYVCHQIFISVQVFEFWTILNLPAPVC